MRARRPQGMGIKMKVGVIKQGQRGLEEVGGVEAKVKGGKHRRILEVSSIFTPNFYSFWILKFRWKVRKTTSR